MATLLRYVRHLRKLNHVGWRVALHQPHIEVTGVKQVVNQLPNLFRSYATDLALKQNLQIKNENLTQNIEDLVQKTGRIFTSNLEQSIEEAKSLGRISSLNALTLIRSCGRPLIDANPEKSIKLLHEVLDMLKKFNVEMDISHYNALLDVYLENEFDFSPTKFLSMLAEKNIEPNRITYRRLMAGYCNKGDIAGATKILEEMKNKNMPLCENIFISLIKGHSESGDMESAVNTVNVMKNSGIQASADTYSSLMCAYAKRGDIDAITKTLELIKTEEISLLDYHYLDIMNVLVDNGHMNQAEEFLNVMPKVMRSDTCVARLAIQLAHKGQLDFAIKILKSTNMDVNRNIFRFNLLMKAMILNRFKVEDIVYLCDIIHKEFKSDKGYLTAIYNALTNGFEHNVVIDLMKKWKETGGKINEHFFWPLLITYGKSNNILGAVEVLKHMIEDFNISPSIETLRDYVMRQIPGSVEKIFEMLKSLNIPENTILIATVARLIIGKQIRTAFHLMATHPSVYPKEELMHSLVSVLPSWENSVKPFVAILRHLSDGSEAANPDQVPTSLVDEFINKVTIITPKNQLQVIKKLLDELVISGLTISTEAGEQFKNYLGSNINDEDLKNIEKLTSGKLTVVPIAEYYQTPDKPFQLMMNSQRQHVDVRKFNKFMEQKNVEGVEHTLRSMESTGVCYSWVVALAIGIFSETNRIHLAEEYFEKFKTSFPDAKLGIRKVLQFAYLLINNNKVEEAIKLVSEQSDEHVLNSYPDQQYKARKILDAIALTKNPENVVKMFEILKNKKLMNIDNHVLSPIVKVHIICNDLEKAMEVFEHACSEYKCAPYKNGLTIELIKTEDAYNLQKLTNLLTELYGESVALLDLAFAFVECGKIRQARKIFETPGLQIKNNKIVAAIEHFQKFAPESLNLLVTATKDVSRMDRGFLYNELLNVYVDNNDWQRGLALWIELQDDYVMPNKMFLIKLRNLLKKNNQNVPFVVDSENESELGDPKSSCQVITLSEISTPIRVGPFEDAIMAQDYTKAVALISSDSPKYIAIGKYMRLINHALKNDRIDVALELIKASITKYKFVYKSIFVTLGDKLVEFNQVDQFEELEKLMNTHIKDITAYGKFLSRAQIKIHGLKNYMNSFEIPKIVTRKSIVELEKNIHFGTLTKGLLRDDSCLNEFESWVEELAKKGVSRGKHSLWCYYFIKNHPKAETLWVKEISRDSSPLIKPIADYAIQNKDVELMEKLMQKLETHPKLSLNTAQKSLVNLMKFYHSVGRYDDSLKVFEQTIQKYRPQVIPTNMVLELKKGLERNGKQFKYEIKYEAARYKTNREINSELKTDEYTAEENLSN